jgi:hypothetical protein
VPRSDLTTSPCPSLLPFTGSNTPITFTLTITNTGQSAVNVVVSNLPALFVCTNGSNIVVAQPILLPVGGSTTISGCTLVACPAGANFNVAVQGTAVSCGTNCIFDAAGNVIRTAVSRCEACVQCPVAVFCRTTGGGQLIQGFTVGQNETNGTGSNAVVCIPQVTTLFPTQSCTGLILEKVTHGGQLGAPYGQKDCGEVLGNPCIRGQWQHVRHYQGQGNPRDVIDAFHTATPKGSFDSMNCACLPCCTNSAGDVHQPNGNFSGQDKFEVCNKEDHRICGPQPRPAPANALIWTGLAKSSLCSTNDANGNGNGNNQVWLVVRVYIEDRSEPGGGHPGGSINPADIYCFQAWPTGVPVDKGGKVKPDLDNIAVALRTALAQQSCAFLDALSSGALPIGSLPPRTVTVGGAARPATIVDCGPLQDGNRQIHPSTGAICAGPVDGVGE